MSGPCHHSLDGDLCTREGAHEDVHRARDGRTFTFGQRILGRPLLTRTHENLILLLGFEPHADILDHVVGVLWQRCWDEEPYLLAAMFCFLSAWGDDEWRVRAESYARRGGYNAAALFGRAPEVRR